MTQKPVIEYKRNGGLIFLRIGRIGGSVYYSARAPKAFDADQVLFYGVLAAFAAQLALWS